MQEKGKNPVENTRKIRFSKGNKTVGVEVKGHICVDAVNSPDVLVLVGTSGCVNVFNWF